MQHAGFVRVVEVQAGPFVVDAFPGTIGGGAGRAAPCASADRFGREVVNRHVGDSLDARFWGCRGLRP